MKSLRLHAILGSQFFLTLNLLEKKRLETKPEGALDKILVPILYLFHERNVREKKSKRRLQERILPPLILMKTGDNLKDSSSLCHADKLSLHCFCCKANQPQENRSWIKRDVCFPLTIYCPVPLGPTSAKQSWWINKYITYSIPDTFSPQFQSCLRELELSELLASVTLIELSCLQLGCHSGFFSLRLGDPRFNEPAGKVIVIQWLLNQNYEISIISKRAV